MGTQLEKLVEYDKVEGHVFYIENYHFLKEKFGKMTGTVYYPGSGKDFTPIFALTDCDTFVYQDFGVSKEEFIKHLKDMEQMGILENLVVKRFLDPNNPDAAKCKGKILFDADANLFAHRLSFDFNVNNKPKNLILYYGKLGNVLETQIPEVRNANLVYLNGMSLRVCVIPQLKVGTHIKSSMSHFSPGYFDLPGDTDVGLFGLEVLDEQNAIFRKTRHIDQKELMELRKNIIKQRLLELENRVAVEASKENIDAVSEFMSLNFNFHDFDMSESEYLLKICNYEFLRESKKD
jgi:hypothetical protein